MEMVQPENLKKCGIIGCIKNSRLDKQLCMAKELSMEAKRVHPIKKELPK
jgi:hypothetical protein